MEKGTDDIGTPTSDPEYGWEKVSHADANSDALQALVDRCADREKEMAKLNSLEGKVSGLTGEPFKESTIEELNNKILKWNESRMAPSTKTSTWNFLDSSFHLILVLIVKDLLIGSDDSTSHIFRELLCVHMLAAVTNTSAIGGMKAAAILPERKKHNASLMFFVISSAYLLVSNHVYETVFSIPNATSGPDVDHASFVTSSFATITYFMSYVPGMISAGCCLFAMGRMIRKIHVSQIIYVAFVYLTVFSQYRTVGNYLQYSLAKYQYASGASISVFLFNFACQLHYFGFMNNLVMYTTYLQVKPEVCGTVDGSTDGARADIAYTLLSSGILVWLSLIVMMSSFVPYALWMVCWTAWHYTLTLAALECTVVCTVLFLALRQYGLCKMRAFGPPMTSWQVLMMGMPGKLEGPKTWLKFFGVPSCTSALTFVFLSAVSLTGFSMLQSYVPLLQGSSASIFSAVGLAWLLSLAGGLMLLATSSLTEIYSDSKSNCFTKWFVWLFSLCFVGTALYSYSLPAAHYLHANDTSAWQYNATDGNAFSFGNVFNSTLVNSTWLNNRYVNASVVESAFATADAYTRVLVAMPWYAAAWEYFNIVLSHIVLVGMYAPLAIILAQACVHLFKRMKKRVQATPMKVALYDTVMLLNGGFLCYSTYTWLCSYLMALWNAEQSIGAAMLMYMAQCGFVYIWVAVIEVMDLWTGEVSEEECLRIHERIKAGETKLEFRHRPYLLTAAKKLFWAGMMLHGLAVDFYVWAKPVLGVVYRSGLRRVMKTERITLCLCCNCVFLLLYTLGEPVAEASSTMNSEELLPCLQ